MFYAKMFPCMIKTFIMILLLFIVVTFANGQDRQLFSKLNPGCEVCDSNVTLIYTRAQGPHDTIHQIWDFTHSVPSIVYVVGTVNSNLSILWNESQPDRFLFSDRPLVSYSFAAAFESIIEYNDLKDNGQFEPDIPESNIRHWSLANTTWSRVDTDMVLTDKEAMVAMRGVHPSRPGIVELQLDILPYKDYASDLPHLIHSANSTLVDVRLVNFTRARGFNSSRFALRLVLASTDDPWTTWTESMRKSLDDEHTPGVFEIIELKSARAQDGGFVQFRPVAYTQRERSVSSSTNAYITGLNKSELPARSVLPLLYGDYFGARPRPRLAVQRAVVSFGLAGDGFYSQHNFTAWSFTIGYGAPPLEGFSLFVIIIISIGLGLPALLALAGAAYVLARRCKRSNPPARFTNDD